MMILKMIDIHTHILYNIDDGAATLDDSLNLIKLEIEDDADAIVLTPHFDPYYDSVDEFIEKRDNIYNVLAGKTADKCVKLYAGSEVFYSEMLLYYSSMKPLCFSQKKNLLVEFNIYQNFDKEFFDDFARFIRKFSVIPIIAHVESYEQIRKNYRILNKFRELGCIIQINADHLLDSVNDKFFAKLFKNTLVDIVATDCHDTVRRPPKLKPAMELVRNVYGEEYYSFIMNNQNKIIY